MTTSLFSFFLTVGSDKMAQTDPHGWTLTLISVMVVFSALIVLYFLYSFSGNIFSGKYKRKDGKAAGRRAKTGKSAPDQEVAAAIAMALEAESGCETEVAIATALHLFLSETVHDIEPGFVTIRRNPSKWNDKSLTFRRLPR